MKILFFYTSFRQFEEILLSIKFFQKYKIKNPELIKNNLLIDIIFHNNNREYDNTFNVRAGN